MGEMKIITGVTGEPHVTPAQDAMWHRGIFGKDNIIINDEKTENFKAEIVSNNEIRIRSGICSLQGVLGCIEVGDHATINIDNGEQGKNRVDTISIYYEKGYDNNESLRFRVIKGVPSQGTAFANTSQFETGDIGVARKVDSPLYYVELQGLQIKSIRAAMIVAPSLSKAVGLLKKVFDEAQRYPMKVYEGQAMMNGDEERSFGGGLLGAPTGLCLVFCPYVNGQVVDGNYHTVTIPKKQIEDHPGKGYDIWLNKGDGAVEKYLYIYPDRVKGYKDNNKHGAQNWVLRAMYLI